MRCQALLEEFVGIFTRTFPPLRLLKILVLLNSLFFLLCRGETMKNWKSAPAQLAPEVRQEVLLGFLR
jgi:hypothetical protein